MGHYFYVTPEEYAEAAKLGIRPTMLDRRIREQGWSKERAMTTPPRKITDRKHWAAIAEKNGISYDVFMSRVKIGWSMERATTEPLQTLEQKRVSAARARERSRVYPEKYLRMAERNGIAYATFQYRVRVGGWEYERAATEPIWTPQQRGRFGAQRLREREGDWAAQIFGKRGKKNGIKSTSGAR